MQFRRETEKLAISGTHARLGAAGCCRQEHQAVYQARRPALPAEKTRRYTGSPSATIAFAW